MKKILKYLINLADNLLGRITMYRAVLYCLLFLFAAAVALGFYGLLPYGPAVLAESAVFIVFICWLTNLVFARVFKAPANVESLYITALILFFIITPARGLTDFTFLALAFWASVWAMASKYIFVIKKKHVFNPAAIAVVITALVLNMSASWWVATVVMLPFVLAGGLILTRKIQRFDLVLSFFAAAFLSISAANIISGADLILGIEKALLISPLLFFAFVMLTEPMTTPPTRVLRILYGAFVGFLFAPSIHVGAIYSTPELALVTGNIFSYLVSSKKKLLLRLKEKIKISPDSYDFVFESDQKLKFKPGQYLEWTLAHGRPDSRGNRRYFTIASSPTESEIRMGVKFHEKSSTFKKSLLAMRPGEEIVASQLAGDFVMPGDKSKRLVFIAGGIGITPFRSMVKYLLDKNEKRDLVLFYSNRQPADIIYKDIFDKAAQQLGIKVVYAVTDPDFIPADRTTRQGRISARMIVQEMPDWRQRFFYLSGPHAMVTAFEDILAEIGVKKSRIKKDFFPGF